MSPKERFLDLIQHCRARHDGVTLKFMMSEYSVSERTAQRMTRELESYFPDIATAIGETGQKSWKLRKTGYEEFIGLDADDLAALYLASDTFRNIGKCEEAERLDKVIGKVESHIPARSMLRIEPDLDALLEAQGIAFRPHPSEQLNLAILNAITIAIKTQTTVNCQYENRNGENSQLELAPYGLIVGSRRYLIARPIERDGQRGYLNYRIEALSNISVTDHLFERDENFDLKAYASQAFGSFFHPSQYGSVVWKFSGPAAKRAANFRFHPNQTVNRDNEGNIIVEFVAAGWVEMSWHLQQWGKWVEVLKPEGLREELLRQREGTADVILP